MISMTILLHILSLSLKKKSTQLCRKKDDNNNTSDKQKSNLVVVNQIASNQMKVELVGQIVQQQGRGGDAIIIFFKILFAFFPAKILNRKLVFGGQLTQKVLSQIKQVLVLADFLLVYSNVDRGTRGNTTMLVMTMV